MPRYPKSMTFSGCPTAQAASMGEPVCPASVAAGAKQVVQACESAVAESQQFSIPSVRGQPNLHLDIGVRGRLRLRHHSAKCGQTLIKRSEIHAAERRRSPMDPPCRYLLRLRDGCVRDLGCAQVITGIIGERG